jgi:hypothetical protein
MNPLVVVLDTHALVWFAKSSVPLLGSEAFSAMFQYRSRIVIPSYAFTEIQLKFTPKMDSKKNNMRVPPTPLLRLVSNCSNVRILPRGPATLAWEFKLMRDKSRNGISDQDIPIAAASMVARDYYDGPIGLITKDRILEKWASSMGISIIWTRQSV